VLFICVLTYFGFVRWLISFIRL